MKAIVITKPGDVDVLKLIDAPDPQCGPHDLLVDVGATALNRGDLLQRRGLYPQPGPAPEFEIPGLEFAGRVIEAGALVEDFAVGDRVMGIAAGACYAERVVVHERLAVRVPEALSWHEAASIPEAFITAHDALAQCRLMVGESVLVHAAGSGVGIAAIQVARVMGATPVIGTAGSDEKLERARKLGLDVGIFYKDKNFATETLAITSGRGVDVIVDFIGASYLARNQEALAHKGRMVIVGLLGGIRAELDLATMLGKRLEIRGTTLRARPLEEKVMATRAFSKAVVPHLANGRIRTVIDRVFQLEAAAEAHRYMESNANFGKIILDVNAGA